MDANKTKPSPVAKKLKARAWNADGWYVFFRDGKCEWCGGHSVEDVVSLYPEKTRRQIMAVILKEAMPSGSIPINTDLAFVVVKTRIQKRLMPTPRREVGLLG